MRRLATFVAAGVAAVIVSASPALATDITNPADHPFPITVTVYGQTYHDGQDTLPGYDDYACTAIPGVEYDFAHNEIDYPGGKSATWTEWDRIPGYDVWLQQQKKTAQTKPATGSGSSSGSTSGSSSSGSSSGSELAAELELVVDCGNRRSLRPQRSPRPAPRRPVRSWSGAARRARAPRST